MALYRLAVNNAGRHTAARRNCFASYFPDDAGGKQTTTREGKGEVEEDCAECIKKRRRRSSPSFAAWSTFRLIRLSATNLSVLSPYALCHPPSSPLPFPSSTFFFHSIFLPSFDVSLLLLSPLSLPLNLSCSIFPSSSRLSRPGTFSPLK